MLTLHENSIRKLWVFTTVVDCGGFSAAQSFLGTSAATISVQMKELEAQLGMTLCHRGRSGFRLTEQGRAVYEASQSVLGAFSNFNLATAEIQNRLFGEVRIGLQANMATNPAFQLPETIRIFHSKPNKVEFRMEEASSADQQSRTLEGRYDLSIGIFPNRIPGLDYIPLFGEKVNLYCASNHLLANLNEAEISHEAVQNHAFVSSGTILEQCLTKPSWLPKPTAFTEDMDAAMLMVLSGHYLAFLPEHFARLWSEKGEICAILPDTFSTEVIFHLITKRGGRESHVVDVFIADLLRAHDIEPAA